MDKNRDTIEKKIEKKTGKKNSILNLTTPWSIRNWIQLGVLILTIAIGLQFLLYVEQISGEGMVTIERPPGVEGFLPIGALMGWKLFITTGFWDPIHPAAMVIFGFAGFISIALRKSFCSWFCPAGTISEWIWKFGIRIFGKNYKVPVWIDYPLRGLKYLLLGFFMWVIFTMSTASINAFLQSPYYKLSDFKMLLFFTRISFLSAAVLIILVMASFLIRNFWCRYLCPYGALMGILAFFSPTRIERDSETCIGCDRCTSVCPSYLPVARKNQIYSAECTGCMDCTLICPVENTLLLKTKKFRKKAWSMISMGLVILIFFSGSVYIAKINGYWHSRVSKQELRALVKIIDSPEMTHP